MNEEQRFAKCGPGYPASDFWRQQQYSISSPTYEWAHACYAAQQQAQMPARLCPATPESMTSVENAKSIPWLKRYLEGWPI